MTQIDPKTHYDAAYFTTGKGASHPGQTLVWEGFDAVAEALSVLLPMSDHRSVLDIGCAGGDFASRFLARGWDAYGVDISEYAVQNAVDAVRDRLKVMDISDAPDLAPLPDAYDLITSTDLLEHIFESDLPTVLRWMLGHGKRWYFFNIATAIGERDGTWFEVPEFCVGRGEPFPPGQEYNAESGHVNIRSWRYWAAKFVEFGMTPRWDLMYQFQMRRESTPWWRGSIGWSMPNTWILEREPA